MLRALRAVKKRYALLRMVESAKALLRIVQM
jgi:hypothetical protein